MFLLKCLYIWVYQKTKNTTIMNQVTLTLSTQEVLMLLNSLEFVKPTVVNHHKNGFYVLQNKVKLALHDYKYSILK